MLKTMLTFVGVIVIAFASVSFTPTKPTPPDQWECLINNGGWTYEMKYYNECWYYTTFKFIERGCGYPVPGTCLFWECDLEWEGCANDPPPR